MHFKDLLIVILLIGIVAISFVTFKLVHYYYGQELLTKMDPIFERRSLIVESKKYWFVGDSRIEQWKNIDDILPKELYCNLGIDGQTTAQVLQRTKFYFEQDTSKYVIIQVGINDLKVIGFYPNDEEWIKKTTRENLKALIELCIANGSTPIFMTIFPTGKVEIKRKLFWSKKVEMAIIEVNQEISSYCSQKNVPVFDSYGVFVDKNGEMNSFYESDCLHINNKGYEFLGKKLEKYLKHIVQ